MNYLAHAFLSPDDPEVLMGNLWGDLLKPADYASLTPGILDGVILHKRIDTFTDQHPQVDAFIHLVRPYQNKYTPVVVDVLMDFILSKYWNQYHPDAIEDFCQEKYKVVNKYLPLIPERLHTRIGRMMENRWLESCKTKDHMKVTLHMLSRRASFENKIQDAMQPYELHEEEMDSMFISFFQELRSTITTTISGQPSK